MRQPKPSPRTGKGDRLRWMRSPRSGLWIHLRRVRWGGRRALSHLKVFTIVLSQCLRNILDSGTGDGPLSHYLLVQKQPIRPIFDVIIIEKQASIKSLIPKTPRGQALGVPCFGFSCAVSGGTGNRPLSQWNRQPVSFPSHSLTFSSSST